MEKIKSILDFVQVFGDNSQNVLDFITDKRNQEKFKNYFNPDECKPADEIEVPSQELYNKYTQIGIALTNGTVITKGAWLTNQYAMEDVIGIAVITPNVQFIIALDEFEAPWGDNLEDCITFEHREAEAVLFLNGYETTKAVVDAQTSEFDTAAKLCWDYNYNGRQWYCPSLYELGVIYGNLEIINDFLDLVHGTKINPNVLYWSSIEANEFGAYYLIFSTGEIDSSAKTAQEHVRPVTLVKKPITV